MINTIDNITNAILQLYYIRTDDNDFFFVAYVYTNIIQNMYAYALFRLLKRLI